jgi:3-methyladenine DNA glycosylase AlkD
MKNLFSFYGIKKPLRSEITKPVIEKAKGSITEDWLLKVAVLLWDKKEREYHYIAMDLFSKNRKWLTPKSFKIIEKLVLQHSWWDSVDSLTGYAISPLVFKYPELKKEMVRFSTHKNMWLRRISLIHQLPYKNQTDKAFLFAVCKKNMADTDFFIRKAIGWALRQYAKTNPKEVYDFVEANKEKLSNLSIREALKHK